MKQSAKNMLKSGNLPGFNKEDFETTAKSVIESSDKFMVDLSGNAKMAEDCLTLDVNALIPFPLKEEIGFDFSYPEKEFEKLCLSVQENGQLEPILVRSSGSIEGKYEIISGEHRWRALLKLGETRILARVLRNLSDASASQMFLQCNLAHRDLSVSDKIRAWGAFYNLHQQEKKQGYRSDLYGKPDEEGENISNSSWSENMNRDIYFYIKMNNLISDWMPMLDSGDLSVASGYSLSFLTQEQQQLIYSMNFHIHVKQARVLQSIAKKEPQFVWTKENVTNRLLLGSKRSESNYTKAGQCAKTMAMTYINPYTQIPAEEIVQKAIVSYLRQHPEYLRDGTKLEDLG